MSRRTYPKAQCGLCEAWISNAGAAKVAHSRMHAREGRLVEMYSRILDKTEFFTPEQAKGYAEATTPQENYANWMRVNASEVTG